MRTLVAFSVVLACIGCGSKADPKAALTDEIIDEIAVFGTEEECRERISWCAQVGVHTHILTPLPGMTADEIRRTYEAFRGFNPGR